MNEKLKSLCDSIVKICAPSKIILYGCKTSQITGEVREVNLLVVVNDRSKEWEKELYCKLESDFAFNLLVYCEENFKSLTCDPTSYAASIVKKGTVLYG